MSALKGLSRNDLVAKAKLMIPRLLADRHKGQAGRIAVIGGSEEYVCYCAFVFT